MILIPLRRHGSIHATIIPLRIQGSIHDTYLLPEVHLSVAHNTQQKAGVMMSHRLIEFIIWKP